jgi:hypothetical protein
MASSPTWELAWEAEILNVAVRLGRVQAEQGVVALPSIVGSLTRILDVDQPFVRCRELPDDPAVDDLVGHRSKEGQVNRGASTTSPDHASSDMRLGRTRTSTPGPSAIALLVDQGDRPPDLLAASQTRLEGVRTKENAGQHRAECRGAPLTRHPLRAAPPSKVRPAPNVRCGLTPCRARGQANGPIPPAGRPHGKISCLDARQLLDHVLAGPLPLLQEDQEIGHLLPVRPLVELPDDVGADLVGEVRTRRRSRRAAGPSASARRAASSQNTGASVSAAWPQADGPCQSLHAPICET